MPLFETNVCYCFVKPKIIIREQQFSNWIFINNQ